MGHVVNSQLVTGTVSHWDEFAIVESQDDFDTVLRNAVVESLDDFDSVAGSINRLQVAIR